MIKKSKIFPKIKILLVLFSLIIMSGVGTVVMGTKFKSVEITLSDGYKMTVLTNKNNVSEILKDNNILIQDYEKVAPSEAENITEERSIVISNKSKQEVQVAKVSESGIESTIEHLLSAYDSIVEKIEVEEEEIPFETVEKDISDGAKSTKNKVIQQGKNGLKEITYKVKYQNDTEIDRTKISEEIIKEPVDKIVQIRSDVVEVSSRASSSVRSDTSSSSDDSVKIFKVTAYCPCSKCCGKFTGGQTSSGKKATSGRTVAASSQYSFGTKLLINGKEYVVEDRGGAIKGNRIDIYMDSHSKALAWGVKYLPVKVIK